MKRFHLDDVEENTGHYKPRDHFNQLISAGDLLANLKYSIKYID